MAIEIERKFLLNEIPPPDLLGPGQLLRQGYLAEEGEVSVRIRITDLESSITVKVGRGLTRTEVEAPVSGGDAEALWPGTAGRRIEKIRYRVRLGGPGGPVAEVDVYEDGLAGLCVAEVEFRSEAEARAFVAPDWFGRELTDQAGWSNAALARYGIPS